MKKILYILLTTVMLTSCEDMFRKMVVYNGDEETPVLCVNAEITVGRPVKVFVTRSWFFLDENRFVGDPRNQITRRGIVGDATVEMQVNGGEWQRLSFVHLPDTTIYSHVTEQASYYTIDYDFRAGDVVTIRAQHPDYETVTATEKVPAKPQFTISNAEFFGNNNQVLALTFDVNALNNSEDNIVFFSVISHFTITDTIVITMFEHRDYGKGYGEDSSYYMVIARHGPCYTQRTYSEDFMFSEYDLPRTQHGFYTQDGPLYTSADHFNENRQVVILSDLNSEFYGKDLLDTLEVGPYKQGDILPQHPGESYVLDSVQVGMRISNYAFYMYRTTVMANSGGVSSYAPEISLYSNEGGGEGYGDIFSELAELFSELGVQESFQAYTNVNGGFGHFCFLNKNYQMLYYNTSH